MTYNAADQLVSTVLGKKTMAYTYNTLSNRVSTTPSTGTPTTYTFNQADDMVGLVHGATTTTYAYNGDGLRMSKTVKGVSTAFTWDVHTGVPLLLSDGTASYVYGPGGLPLEQITGSTTHYYHHDQLGSTTMLTDQTGERPWRRTPTTRTGSCSRPPGASPTRCASQASTSTPNRAFTSCGRATTTRPPVSSPASILSTL